MDDNPLLGALADNGRWFWTCQGSNGGQNASCSADYTPPVDSLFSDRFQTN